MYVADSSPVTLNQNTMKNIFSLIWFLSIRSQQTFAHDISVKVLGHVQNFVVIILLDFEWLQNELSIQITTVMINK